MHPTLDFGGWRRQKGVHHPRNRANTLSFAGGGWRGQKGVSPTLEIEPRHPILRVVGVKGAKKVCHPRNRAEMLDFAGGGGGGGHKRVPQP